MESALSNLTTVLLTVTKTRQNLARHHGELSRHRDADGQWRAIPNGMAPPFDGIGGGEVLAVRGIINVARKLIQRAPLDDG